MLAHRHVAQCGLMVSDRSRGRVASVLGRPVVRYDLGAADARTFHDGPAAPDGAARGPPARAA